MNADRSVGIGASDAISQYRVKSNFNQLLLPFFMSFMLFMPFQFRLFRICPSTGVGSSAPQPHLSA